jgi:hypothetical protein
VKLPIEVRSDMDMETKGGRAGDRIGLQIPIEVAGTDCLGSQFLDRTHTLVVGRRGGKISLERKLVPQQEVTIRCLTTGREADARIVGLTGKTTGAYNYGIKFLSGVDNIWGIDFPPLSESEESTGRVFLECFGCKNREVICLDDFELEVLQVNGNLSRPCNRCRDVSLWREFREDIPESEIAASASSPPVAPERRNMRRESRREIKAAACVRTTRFGQDLVKIRNISRGGLCFTTPREYFLGEIVEVAAPYWPGGGNIFLSAEIVWLQPESSEKTTAYGVVFQSPKG